MRTAGKIVVTSILSAAVSAYVVWRREKKRLDNIQKIADRHWILFQMMNQWVRMKQEGKSLAQYLEKTGYRKIAIYGIGYAGEILFQDLKGSGIEVAYGIDRNAESICSEVDVDIVKPDDDLKPVDAVVVTAVTFLDEVSAMLSRKMKCPILSLDDILYDM